MPAKAKREAGQALPLALILLAVGALITGPLLGYVNVGLGSLQKGADTMGQYYAADSGVEHAIWRIRDDGLVLNENDPFPYTFSTVNGLSVDIIITNKSPVTDSECDDNNPSGQSDRVEVGRAVSPLSAPPGQPTTFSYTVTFTNIGTGNIHFNEIGYTLPAGFSYVNGSSSGVTVSNPQVIDGSLVWQFDPPLPDVPSGETMNQYFQATGTLDDGVYCGYCDAAWVIFEPDSVGCVVFISAELYNIQATAGGTYVRSAVLVSVGDVRVLSWETK
ncbi:MAG: hypothetical protein HY671_04810 [Chloroflexi bacterium]|nr:hypothetical protein [Chloroflexota bacterium]